MRKRISLGVTNTAALLLPEVIKCLIQGRDENLGWRAAQSLSESSLQGQLLLPALTNATPIASTRGRRRIFRCLHWSKYPAKEAVPVLRKALLSPDVQLQQEATWALQRIAPEVLTKPKVN
jgi:HEAT repeat protein